MEEYITQGWRRVHFVLIVKYVVSCMAILLFFLFITQISVPKVPVTVEGIITEVGIANGSALIDIIETAQGTYYITSPTGSKYKDQWGTIRDYKERQIRIHGFLTNRYMKIYRNHKVTPVQELVVSEFELLE